MDLATNTEDEAIEIKTNQENLLLNIIKQICSEPKGKLSPELKAKVNRIIVACKLNYYSSLHTLSTAQPSTSTLLGVMHQTATELTFDEQVELNEAIVDQIRIIIPAFNSELESFKQLTVCDKLSRKDEIKKLQESLYEKLNTLEEQENVKAGFMLEWLNHRLQEATTFSNHSSELLTLKSNVLELKSKILHLQILQNIFTETNQSIKSYTAVHRDLTNSIKETEENMKKLKEIIDSDY